MQTSDIIAGISATIASISAAASLWALWRTEQTRGAVLRSSWDQSREHRKTFWRVVRATYANFHKDKSGEWPNDVSTVVAAGGMPPNVPVGKGAQVKNWYDDHQKYFNVESGRIAQFVVAIYPPRTDITVDLMDDSIVDSADRDSFDNARRQLATFFHRQQQQTSNRALYKVVSHTFDDVVLLAWLELALARGTKDESPGKEGYQGKKGLFEFGNFMAHKR